VVKITEINGQNVSSLVDGTDYNILENWIVEFPTLDQYIRDLKFSTFKIKYEVAWAINERYKGAISSICGYFLWLDLWKEIQSEQLWPRKVQYASQLQMWSTSAIPKAIEQHVETLLSFIPLHYKIW
jgi:hypothetical protein